MKFKQLIFLLLSIFWQVSLVFGQIDTNYVYQYKNKVSLGLKLGALSNNFILQNDYRAYNINSNITPTVAIWFKYKKLPSISIAIPFTNFSADTLAKTRGIGIDLKGQVAKGFIIDGFFFFERGFNLQNRANHKDIKPLYSSYNLNINLELFYLFSHKRFSYRSAYLFGEIQKKSKGSFTAGLSTGYLKLHNFRSYFPSSQTSTASINLLDLSTFNISLLGGYTHTFVLGKEKHWFTNMGVFVGPTLNIGSAAYFDNTEHTIFRPGIRTKYKFALGYNYKKWTTSIQSTGDFMSFKPSDLNFINNNIIDVKLSGIYKF